MFERLGVHYRGPVRFDVEREERVPFRLQLRCSETLPAGTEICPVLGGFRAMIEGDWTLQRVSVDGDDGEIEVGHGVPGPFAEAEPWERFKVAADRIKLCSVTVERTVPRGADIDFEFTGKGPDHTHVDTILAVVASAPERAGYERIGHPVVLGTDPGPPANIEVRSASTPDDSGRVRVTVLVTDSSLNPTPYAGPISLAAEGAVEGLPDAVRMERAHGGSVAIGGVRVDGDGPARIEARSDRHGFHARSPAVVPDRRDGWHTLFGALHFHTRFSGDGDGDVSDAYAYARDDLNLDFAGVTDHYPRGDWEATLDANESFDDPGTFVTMPAWEWNTDRGHLNLYLRSPAVDAGPGHYDPDGYPYEVSWPDSVVLSPHHTNVRSAKADDGSRYWTEYDWSVRNDRIRLVEVVQTRGSFEADEPDDDWGILTGGAGASVRDALAMGHRVGIVGGTDNHSATPTRDHQRPGRYAGLTGVLASAHSRESIWDALDARRTFATSGVPIVCHVRVNGALMGRERPLDTADGVTVSASLYGTAPIERVEVISEGDCVWSTDPDARDVTIEEQAVPEPTGESAYYYLRLRQTDGHVAWSSPVWLDVVDG